MIRVELTIPPSVNGLHGVGKHGRFKRRHYREWCDDAGWELKLQKPATVSGPYRLMLMLPVGMRGDVDNRMKAVSDLLVAHGVTPDDRHASAMSQVRSAVVPPGRCIVIIIAETSTDL